MRNQHKSSSPYPEWNNKKFEAKLEKEIQQRKNLISISANYILPDQDNGSMHQIGDPNGEMLVDSTGIYKQFLLIGIPPSVENSHDPNVKPAVLIAYPPFEYPNMPIKKIIEHSMPTGPSREFLSNNTLSPIQDEFVFQFGGGEGKPIYGVCVHVSTKDTSLPFYGHKTDKDRIFCFCLMTKMPAFSVHFSFLTSLVLWTIGHVRHLHKYENKIRVNITPGEPIDDLDLEDQIGHHPSVAVPVSFQNEIASYFISNISSKPEKLSRASSTFMQGYVTRKLEKMNNKRHNFRYDTEDCSIELKFPPVKDISENSITWASLDTLFSLLSVPDILSIISGLLLDRQVLIIGSRLEEVSMTVWALQSILRPFKFAGTVIPILPTTSEDYLGLLQLPTPFLFGVPRCNELKAISFLETAVFVDLDKKNVPPIEDLPDYPNDNVVKTKLTKFLYSIKNKKELNEYSLPLIYKKTLNHKYSFSPSSCLKICEIISSPFQNSIYSNYICGFFVSAEGVTVFNEELFLGQIYSLITTEPQELYGETTPLPSREKEKEKRVNEEMDFWNNIVESQTFQMYIEERMLSFMDMKKRAISTDNFQENKNESEYQSSEDDAQKKASESEIYDYSSNDEEIKDIDKLKNSTKKDNQNNLRKRRTMYNFNQIDATNDSKPSSNQPKITMNRSKKIPLKNPQRIKSLKSVLADLPTPSSSNNKLLDMDNDRVKSDPDADIDDDNLNENLRLSNQKISKSSNLAVRSNLYVEEEDNNENKQRIKSSKNKNLNKKVEDENEKANSKTQKNKQNQKKQQQRKNSNNSDNDNSSDNENDQETTKKHRKSSGNENKPATTTKTSKQTKNHSNKNDNQNNSDDEPELEPTKKQRKSNESKPKSKSQKPTRAPLLISSDDDEVEQNKTTKKTRKSNETKPAKSQKPTRKSSNNEDNNDHQKSNNNNNNNSENENEPETTKKQRKSNESKRTTKSQRPSRAPLDRFAAADDESASDDEVVDQQITKRRRKSSEVRRTSKSQKPTRASNKLFEENNSDDDDEEIIEHEKSKRHRKSADVRLTSKPPLPTKRSSNNEDDDNDGNEADRSKRHRRSSNQTKPPTTGNQTKSQKIARKSSNDNDNDDDDIKERNIKTRKSSSNDKNKSTRKSSNENKSDDHDDDTKDRNIKTKKSSSNDKNKPTRKSSNNHDDDDDDDFIKERNLKNRKSISTERFRKSSNNNDDDDDDEENDTKHQKHRRRSVQQSRSSANFNIEGKNQKTQRKSNEDDNNNTRKKTKSSKESNQAVKKSSNQLLNNRQRSRTVSSKTNENDPNKKKIQMQFNSSSQYETYSSDEIDANLFYKDEHWDVSSSYED